MEFVRVKVVRGRSRVVEIARYAFPLRMIQPGAAWFAQARPRLTGRIQSAKCCSVSIRTRQRSNNSSSAPCTIFRLSGSVINVCPSYSVRGHCPVLRSDEATADSPPWYEWYLWLDSGSAAYSAGGAESPGRRRLGVRERTHLSRNIEFSASAPPYTGSGMAPGATSPFFIEPRKLPYNYDPHFFRVHALPISDEVRLLELERNCEHFDWLRLDHSIVWSGKTNRGKPRRPRRVLNDRFVPRTNRRRWQRTRNVVPVQRNAWSPA